MPSWPKYQSKKIVEALPIVEKINGILYVAHPVAEREGDLPGTPPLKESFYPSEPNMAARADVGWYAVKYEDGYNSCSPKDIFEAGHDAL